MSNTAKRWTAYNEAFYGDEEQRLGVAVLLLQNYGLSLASNNSAERTGAMQRLTAEMQIVLRAAYEQGRRDAKADIFLNRQAM